jgi:alkylation response protein AidB-like acyl-CoA dehydrogenase
MQNRMAGGRTDMAMRAIGHCTRIIEMMGERANSRFTQGERLSQKQFVQGYIADSHIELMQFRLAVMYTAWKIDNEGHDAARREVATVKALTPQIMQSITNRAVQVHGALGTTQELPLMEWMVSAHVVGIADGPTEVHRVNLAKQLMKEYGSTDREWPTSYRSYRIEDVRKKYGHIIETIPHLPESTPSLTW